MEPVALEPVALEPVALELVALELAREVPNGVEPLLTMHAAVCRQGQAKRMQLALASVVDQTVATLLASMPRMEVPARRITMLCLEQAEVDRRRSRRDRTEGPVVHQVTTHLLSLLSHWSKARSTCRQATC